MKKLLLNMLLMAIMVGWGIYLGSIITKDRIKKENKVNYNIPYDVKILNDHEVQCTFRGDTVLLFWENAYALSEEQIVFIKK